MIEPKTPNNEDQRLTDLILMDLSNPNKKKQFDGIITILSMALKVPIAYISSIEKETQKINTSCGLNFDSSERKSSFCGHTVLQDDLLIVEDTLEDERFRDNPMVLGEPYIRFYAGCPLSSMLGNNVGALCIADTVPRKLEDQEINAFRTVGRLLTERLRLYKLTDIQKEINESRQQLELLNNELFESNRYFRQVFGQYMSESLLEQMLNEKSVDQLGGEERTVTVLLSDLRGFTSLSECHRPKEVLEILNLYFEEMIEIIQEHDGYINELLGDGMLVVFGAPKQISNGTKKAVDCARAMQQGLLGVNQKLAIKDYPALKMGIGINTGNLIVGNIGSKKRMKYGVVGETINIAARIESLTVAGQILTSETTYNEISREVKAIGKIRSKIKGYEDPIMIYDVSEADKTETTRI